MILRRPEIAITVYVFSTHPQPIRMNLNRGGTILIPDVGNNWQPTSPPPGAVGFDNGGPSANNVGPGPNLVQLQVGTAAVYTVTMNLRDPNPTSIQLYFFADTASAATAHWALLSSGAVTDSDIGVTPRVSINF